MSALVVVAVGVVGGLGAISRFLLDGAVSRRVATSFPVGTFAVNILGAFVLGALAGAALSADAYRVAGTGFIGAFTTFSTWSLESHRLAEDGEVGFAALNFGLSLVCGVLAAWAGRQLGSAL